MAEGHHPGPSTSLQSHHHISHHHHHIRRRAPSGGEEQEEEELDPRIQVELEKLNRASEEINRLELELDDTRAAFRQVLSDSTQCLNGLAKKLGTCVEKARPYYDARMRLKEAHIESQKAALRFERACSMHEAAKEMVQLAEEGYKRREQDLDPTWQEMLNHATMKVNDAERERIESEDFHQRTTGDFKRREEEVQKLQKDLKRAITKSKPYFEMKAKFNQVMEDHKRNVSRLEEDVCSSKALYSQALRSLEAISDDIHRQRLERRQKLQLGVRGAGVGAEAPSPPPSWEKGISIEGSVSSYIFDSDADDDPLNASRTSQSSERALDVNQLKANRSKGVVVRHEPAYRKKTSIAESFLKDGQFKTDPLEVVVFKTSTSDLGPASSPPKSSQDFHPPSVIHSKLDRARTASYRAAVEFSELHNTRESLTRDVVRGTEEEGGDNVITPTPDNVNKLPGALKSSQGITIAHRGPELNVSGSPRRESYDSPLSESPRRRDIELSQSSLSRAQEWVNKSPVPQQRRFVKSKSLIDASSSSLSLVPPSDADLSSSLTTEAIKGIVVKERERRDVPTHAALAATHSSPAAQVRSPIEVMDNRDGSVEDSAIRSQADPTMQPLSTSPHIAVSQNSNRSLGSTPEQGSPFTGSPNTHRKSPRLQGLILRVDATGITPSSAQSTTPSPRGQIYSSPSPPAAHPKVIISTQHPKLGVFMEKVAPPQPVVSPAGTRSTTSPPSSFSSALPPTAKPPSSLIAQQLNKMMNATKVSHYNSKTAPSVLGTSYRLSTAAQKSPHGNPINPQASPTRNPLSPTPLSAAAALRQQLTSPTPSSSSADRYSLSGRSDSVASGSHKGPFLKPPSDSSDTESIASTGPMLDDDQVELINMDFSEQSIIPDGPEDNEYNDSQVDPASVTRGHWSRMSLPPRLSYLEGFLERARIYQGERDAEDKYMEDNSGHQVEVDDDARSSVAASGDLDDKCDDFKDEICDNDNGSNGGEVLQNDKSDINQTGEDCGPQEAVPEDRENQNISDIVVNVQISLDNADSTNVLNNNINHKAKDDANDAKVNEVEGNPTAATILSLDQGSVGETQENRQSTEATIVISPDRGLQVVEGTTTQPTNNVSRTETEDDNEDEEEQELFV